MYLARSRPTVLTWFMDASSSGLQRPHSGTPRPPGASTPSQPAEARAYLAHPLLGPRLILCTETVLALQGRSPHAIFGSPDDLKFCSSMTLFAIATGEGEAVFRRALDHYCEGRMDTRTVALCQTGAG